MKWRLIEEQSYSAQMNMAIDHAVYDGVCSAKSPPTIRIYKWEKPCISVGAYSACRNVDLGYCKSAGVDIVRRMTGGTLMFQGKNDFSFTYTNPIKNLKFNIKKAKTEIFDSVYNLLKDIGINISNVNENLEYKGKGVFLQNSKIFGKGVFLLQGTLLCSNNHIDILKAVNANQPELANKYLGVCSIKKVSSKKIYDAFKSNLCFGKKVEFSGLTEEESTLAESYSKSIYSKFSVANGLMHFRKNFMDDAIKDEIF